MIRHRATCRGLNMIAARLTRGAISMSNSSHLPAIAEGCSSLFFGSSASGSARHWT